jgi:tetratricopeptide (TPR) repeat protein
MKYILIILLIINSISASSQEESPANAFLTIRDTPINNGDYVSIEEFKNIKIVSKTDSSDYQIEFMIAPFEGTWLGFYKKQTELESLDIHHMLEIAEIPESEIMHVTLNLIAQDPPAPILYKVSIYTRQLKTAEDYFTEFLSYAKIADAESSIWLINQAIQVDSLNIKYLNARGQLYYEMGKLSEANDAFEKTTKVQANYASYNYLALINLQTGEYEQSQNYAEESLKYSSNNLDKSSAYLGIGDANAKTYNYQSAYEAYKKAIDLNPKNLNALNNITTVLDEVNRPEEKPKYFNQILNIDSSYYLAHINIGFYYLGEEKYENALNEFNAVLKVDSIQPVALSNKSFALMKLGHLNDALEVINNSINLDPNNSYAHRNKALIYFELKNKEYACNSLMDALKLGFTQQYGDEVLLLKEKKCE